MENDINQVLRNVDQTPTENVVPNFFWMQYWRYFFRIYIILPVWVSFKWKDEG